MIKLRVVRQVKANLPTLVLPENVLEDIGKIGEASILDNIKRQQKATGAPLPRNKQSTIDRKEEKGRPPLSLVDQYHRFVRKNSGSWASQVVLRRQWVIVKPANPEIRQLSQWVQEGGKGRGKIKRGKRKGERKTTGGTKRYRGWFGLNREAKAAIKWLIRDWIIRMFRQAARMQAAQKART